MLTTAIDKIKFPKCHTGYILDTQLLKYKPDRKARLLTEEYKNGCINVSKGYSGCESWKNFSVLLCVHAVHELSKLLPGIIDLSENPIALNL